MLLAYKTSSLLLFTTLLSHLAFAENLNVSQIAIGSRLINWTEEENAPVVSGSWASFDYLQVGHARIQGDPGDFYLNPWASINWANATSSPSLTRLLATPAPSSTLQYASPYYRIAKVDMGSSPKIIQSRTFSSGSAQSALNYSIKVLHFSSQPLDYFIYVYHPKILTGVQTAYTLQPGGPGGAGGTYLDKFPETASSRAAMDVLVDGLPVWSTESTYMFPDGTAGYPWDKLFTSWGNPVTDNGWTKLYLGKLAATKIITISLIVRTDVKADASTCGKEYGSWNSPDTQRCFDLAQTVQLKQGAQVPALYVYGKYLNTTGLIPLPYNPL